MPGFTDVRLSDDHCGVLVLLPGRDGGLEWADPGEGHPSGPGPDTCEPRDTFSAMLHPDDGTVIARMLAEVGVQGRATGTIRVHDRPTGSVRYFQLVLNGGQLVAPLVADPQHPARRILARAAAGTPAQFSGQAWDVTALILRQQELELHAFKDALTGVPNRRTFMTRLDQQLDSARGPARPVAVMFADIDHFKHVNDTLGHHSGDQVLIELARRLAVSLRPEDTLGRIGGDEFAVLCPELNGWPAACSIVDRIRAAACAPISTDAGTVVVTLSVGVAFAEEMGTLPDAAAHLVSLADARMFRAKFDART